MNHSALKFQRQRIFGVAAVFGVCFALYVINGGLQASEPSRVRPPQEATPPTRSIWDGVYTEAQAKRGRSPYLKLCAECHARNLRGSEDSPALVGRAFIRLWNDSTLDELFEVTRTTMPVASPESLSDQVYVDMVAYMLQANKVPPGDVPLEPDLEVLKQIRIEAVPTTP